MPEAASKVGMAEEEKGQMDETSPYLWIRIAAIGILVIFCAIAVTTINEYDKMNDFVRIIKSILMCGG